VVERSTAEADKVPADDGVADIEQDACEEVRQLKLQREGFSGKLATRGRLMELFVRHH